MDRIKIKNWKNVIESQSSMKILGFHTNDKMTLETHCSRSMSKMGLEYHKVKPALDLSTLDQQKINIYSKIRSHIDYFLLLLISQPNYIQDKVKKILMKVNCWMLQDNTFKVRNTYNL